MHPVVLILEMDNLLKVAQIKTIIINRNAEYRQLYILNVYNFKMY